MKLPKIKLPLPGGGRHHQQHQQQHNLHGAGQQNHQPRGVPPSSQQQPREFRRSFDATFIPETQMELSERVLASPYSPPCSPEKNGKKNVASRGGTGGGGGGGGGGTPPLHPSLHSHHAGGVVEGTGNGGGAAAAAPAPAPEARPRLVQWVKSHEWQPDARREWTDEQRREMRWLIHDATEKGVTLQSSDFIAMFPSFPIESIQKSAVEELMTTKSHPPPKKLAWLSQLVIDGDEPGGSVGPSAAATAAAAAGGAGGA